MYSLYSIVTKTAMRTSTALLLSYLALSGFAAPSCYSGAGSYYLQIDGGSKKAVEKIYQEKYTDAKIPQGPLNITVTPAGDLKVNFEVVQAQAFEVNCAGYVECGGTDGVSAETLFNGGDHGGNLFFDGLNDWTVNWNGPNLNLNLPSRGQMRFPTFNLEAVSRQ